MSRETEVIEPGAVLGVLGGGQLGRMFALAAAPRGYRVHVYTDGEDSPASQVAWRTTVGDYRDLDRVRDWAKSVAAVTFEFENIPIETARAAAEHAICRPGPDVLEIAQHRYREKSTLEKAGLPVTPFRRVTSAEELATARADIGPAGVLKTAMSGYDGKGQIRIAEGEDAAAKWAELGTDEAVFETLIEFEREVSVIGVRSADGVFAAFEPAENTHANHVLDTSRVGSALSAEKTRAVTEVVRATCETLDAVGVLCVEFFQTSDGRFLINEFAPRPHNSGHWSIEASDTSQFEQQARTLVGLPPGSVGTRPSVTANLLGDLWEGGAPAWAPLLEDPAVSLHLYGKASAQPGRKMGHFTVTGVEPLTARDAARIAATRDRVRRG
ncbi:MAG: 5-(carboxyamino)imidazole ribonucleotide synthase [Planctomycetota bacterium]